MALPFFEDDLTKLYNDALSDKKTTPNEELKKEVEIGKNGTQKYVIKQGENKGKIL